MGHDLTEEEYKSQVAAVWKATLWLSIITIVEVAFALYWYYNIGDSAPKMLLNGFLIIASLLKAFFIVAEFMHLKYEVRALTLSILVPLVLFIWGIIAFLLEGRSIRHLRELFDIY